MVEHFLNLIKRKYTKAGKRIAKPEFMELYQTSLILLKI